MGIFDKLKRLIFTAGAEAVEQVPVRTVPQPEQAETIAVFRHHRSEVPVRTVPQPEQAQSTKAEELIRFTSASEQLATVLQQSPQKFSFVLDGFSWSSLELAACRAAIYTHSLNLISALAERLSSIDDSIAVIYASLLDAANDSLCTLRNEPLPDPFAPRLIRGDFTSESVIEIMRKLVKGQVRVLKNDSMAMKRLLDGALITAGAYPPNRQAAAQRTVAEFGESLCDLCRGMVVVDGKFTKDEQAALEEIVTTLCISRSDGDITNVKTLVASDKKLLASDSSAEDETLPVRTVPQPERAQSSKAGDNEPRFSENDMLAVQQRAETVQRAFNESLSIANQSKNRGTREHRLQIAREGLIELKQLANKFPFLHLTNLQAVESSIIAVEAETRLLPYGEALIRHVADNVDSSATSASCWVKVGTEIMVKGLTIPGGMLYFGKGLARIRGDSIEPALINPGLPVNMPAGPVEQMSYWPSYSDISPTARGEYLQWLAGGRKDPNVQIGYVFLFFYGMERRVLADARQYPEVAQELPALLAEVRRLLSIYENQGSFYGYASRFLDLVVTVGAKDRIYKLPPPPQGQHKALTLRHKIALGQAAVDGAPLPAAWAYSWLVNDERFYPRMPASRCQDEFKNIFLDAYAKKFDQGLKLPVNKTKLKALYKPASASFSYGQVELTGADVPDITVPEGTFNRLREIADSATAQLEPYSRYVGRNPEKKGSREAMVLLPPALWAAENARSLTSWLVKLGADKASQVATFSELMQHFPAGAAPKKDGYLALASGLEQLGVGIEPDIRWGGPLPSEASKVVLFPILAEERATKPSPPYSAAILTLHLAAAVTAADNGVSAQEEEHLEEQLERWIHLGAAEFSRLRAHLKWLLLAPPALTMLKKRVSVLTDDQKRAIAAFLIAVAQAEGGVSPAEVKVLIKVYRLFGLDEKELYSQAHTAATEPVTVKPSAAAITGFGVPPKPMPRPIGAIALDHERIAVLTADSERVSAILGAIFIEEVQPAEPVVPAEPEVAPTGVSIVGLDASYSELVRVLISRDTWTRAELEDLAADRGIMLDGALDHINEAFLDVHSEPLLDGEDPVDVNKNMVKELEAA